MARTPTTPRPSRDFLILELRELDKQIREAKQRIDALNARATLTPKQQQAERAIAKFTKQHQAFVKARAEE